MWLDADDMKHAGTSGFPFVVDPSGYGWDGRSRGEKREFRNEFWKEWNDSSLPVFEPGERNARRKRRDD